MALGFFEILALFMVGFVSAIFSLAGVLLGGWLVFRTKRGGDEALFSRPEAEGGVGIAVGEYDDDGLELGTDTTARLRESQGRHPEFNVAAADVMTRMHQRWQRQASVGTGGGAQ